ncbi:MAG TPA: helix-turn-helix transcriptional regulator [Streptomyces sp.]
MTAVHDQQVVRQARNDPAPTELHFPSTQHHCELNPQKNEQAFPSARPSPKRNVVPESAYGHLANAKADSQKATWGLLRHYRTRAKLTLADAATVLDWDNTRLSRVETGQYRIKSAEVSTLLSAYGVTSPEVIAEVTRVIDTSQQA